MTMHACMSHQFGTFLSIRTLHNYSFHFHLQILLDHDECIHLCSVTELYHHNTPLHVAARMGKAQAVQVATYCI